MGIAALSYIAHVDDGLLLRDDIADGRHIVNLDEDESYDPTDRVAAMAKVMETNSLCCGIIYQNKERKSYEELVPNFSKEPLAKQDLMLSREDFESLVAEFK